MAIFFLMIGLELERGIYVGELSKLRNALLPAFAAVGGMAAPALIHFALNAGTATEAGFGIPMATDIAFALAVMALLGARVPVALKLFIVAFAIIDDLGAIVLIATVYTAEHLVHLAGAGARHLGCAHRTQPAAARHVAVALSRRRRVPVVLRVQRGRSRIDRRRHAGIRHTVLAAHTGGRVAVAPAGADACTSRSRT